MSQPSWWFRIPTIFMVNLVSFIGNISTHIKGHPVEMTGIFHSVNIQTSYTCFLCVPHATFIDDYLYQEMQWDKYWLHWPQFFKFVGTSTPNGGYVSAVSTVNVSEHSFGTSHECVVSECSFLVNRNCFMKQIYWNIPINLICLNDLNINSQA